MSGGKKTKVRLSRIFNLIFFISMANNLISIKIYEKRTASFLHTFSRMIKLILIGQVLTRITCVVCCTFYFWRQNQHLIVHKFCGKWQEFLTHIEHQKKKVKLPDAIFVMSSAIPHSETQKDTAALQCNWNSHASSTLLHMSQTISVNLSDLSEYQNVYI